MSESEKHDKACSFGLSGPLQCEACSAGLRKMPETTHMCAMALSGRGRERKRSGNSEREAWS